MHSVAIMQKAAPPARRWVIAVALAVLVATLGFVASAGDGDTADAQTPPISTEVLTPRSEFTDDVHAKIGVTLEGEREGRTLKMRDPSRTVVVRVTVPPGAAFPWHSHPGPGIFNVASGETVYVQASDCVERPYPTGTAFVDPGRGVVHTLFNPGDEPAVLLVTFFEAPAEGPLVITEGITPPTDCEVGVPIPGAAAHP